MGFGAKPTKMVENSTTLRPTNPPNPRPTHLFAESDAAPGLACITHPLPLLVENWFWLKALGKGGADLWGVCGWGRLGRPAWALKAAREQALLLAPGAVLGHTALPLPAHLRPHGKQVTTAAQEVFAGGPPAGPGRWRGR